MLLSFMSKKTVPVLSQIIVRSYAKKGGVTALGSKKAKGGKGGVHQRIRLTTETDAHKLATQVCGLNYINGTEEVLIKPDSEYPDWLWSLVDEKPKKIEELDPNDFEYWKIVRRHSRRRMKKLMKINRY